MNKNYLFLIIILLLPIVYAEMETWQYGKKDELMNISFPCKNQATGELCSGAASCSLTMNYPNGSLWLNNVSMINQGTYQTYKLSNTSLLGKYFVIWHCKDGATYGSGSFYIEINKLGQEEQSNGLTIAFIIIFLIISIVLLGWAFLIDGDNSFTMGPEGNRLIEINYAKYAKLVLYFFSYFFFWITTFWLWQYVDRYTMYDVLTSNIKQIFIIETALLIPILIICISVGFMKHLTDSDILKWQKRGLPLR